MRVIEGPVMGLRPKRGKKTTIAAGRFFESRSSVAIPRATGYERQIQHEAILCQAFSWLV